MNDTEYCPECRRDVPAGTVREAIFRDCDGSYTARGCAECRGQSALELAIMGRLASQDARDAKDRRNAARRARHAAYTDLGMTRVRGNLGGVYYE